MKYYRQCTFKSGNSTTTAWIEERGAKVGKKVTFKDEDEKRWWEVTAVSDTRMDEQRVKEQEKNAKNHRKASDI